MDEEAIETIRETSRTVLGLNRRKLRDEEVDIRRSMENTRINPDAVAAISSTLKTKAAISVSELQTLKNALIDDVTNIEVVLQTHGALRGLVQEITGHEVNKQCAAAGCCCNLALGDARAGVTVAKATGPYLVTALDSLTTELAVTSAWTLGNLAGSGPRACELLTAQGAVAKLCDLLNSSNEESRDAALYAIVHFAYQLKDEFKTEHLHKVLDTIPQLDIFESSQLLFILSCHKDFTPKFLTEEFLLKILKYFTVSSDNVNSPNIMYLFRFLANLNSEEVFMIVLNYFISKDMVDFVKKLVETDEVSDSVIWFLGNAFKCCSNHVIFERLLT